jgi:hypothetical protein
MNDMENAQLEANIRSMRAALNGEQARIQFIRDAAVQLDAALHGNGQVVTDAGTLWQRARVLWDAKPEDC